MYSWLSFPGWCSSKAQVAESGLGQAEVHRWTWRGRYGDSRWLRGNRVTTLLTLPAARSSAMMVSRKLLADVFSITVFITAT